MAVIANEAQMTPRALVVGIGLEGLLEGLPRGLPQPLALGVEPQLVPEASSFPALLR